MKPDTAKPIVAVLLNAFWVHGDGMSGGDQMAIQIFRRVHRLFSEVWWFSNPDGKRAAQHEKLDALHVTTPAWFDRLGLALSYVLRTLWAVIRLNAVRPQIVYSGSDFFPDVLPAWILRKVSPRTRWIQCVFHIYPTWNERPGNRLINWLGSRAQDFSLRLARSADGMVVINSEVRDILKARGFVQSRVEIISPGIDFERIEATQPELNGELIYDAVFIGRLKHSKGIFDLPLIWDHVTNIRPDARLAVIGGGSEQIKFKMLEMISAHGHKGRIDLLGFLPTEQIYCLLKSAKLFVFPSHEEGFGIAVAEALATRLPVVTWDLPVFEELFGSVVIRVPRGNHEAFAVEVVRSIAQEYPEICRSNAATVAMQYGWKNVADRMGRWLLSGDSSGG
jgi:glycosyltransferase involved in cell wall biosynthesis